MNAFIVQTEIDGRQREITLTLDGATDGNSAPVALAPTDHPNVWHWIDGATRVPVHIVSDGVSSVAITVRGYRYTATVHDKRHYQLLDILKSSPSQQHRVTKISAPMPGLLKAIGVTDGQTVRKGETLFTLEAMKMENAIKTPVAGVVRNIAAVEGSALEKGAMLCTVEPIVD